MSKYNRNGKARKIRKPLRNVGDGGKLSQDGQNPNDSGAKGGRS